MTIAASPDTENAEPKKKGLNQDQVLALIDSYAASSYGYDHGTLAQERALAIARYNSEPTGDEIDGRSQLVSSELRDTVETVIPQLMRIFLGGDQICEFDPEEPEDVDKSKQESKYVNWVITQKNSAFQNFGTWFRDALLCKNGYIKAYWEDRSDITMEQYKGLTDVQFEMVLQDVEVTPTQHTAYPDPSIPPMNQMAQAMPGAMPQQPQAPGMPPMPPPQQPMLHDVVLRRKKTRGYVRYDNVPAEEMRVHHSTRGPDLSDSIYVEHRTPKTLSEIRQMGYNVPDEWAGKMDDPAGDIEAVARDRFAELQFLTDDDGADPSTRRATFREVWMRCDEDGDGIAELRKVCLVNRHILADDETDIVPIACITPVIQPHRHVGYGYYDFLKNIEAARTAMLRAFFDNIYLANNGRYGVDVNVVNVDDLLISRPGGIVRTKGNPANGIMPITHPNMGEAALSGMNYLDGWKKSATGVIVDAEALSADVLNNSTATGISQAISVWQARIEGVARCFAETGMTDLFRIVHALTLKNATTFEKVQLSGQWVQIDPREWVKRTSLTVTVGLGTGSKEAKLAFLQQVAQGQMQGIQIGIATPENIYQTALEMMKEGGFKDGQRFWTDPAQNPATQQPPKDDPLVAAEKVKGQNSMALDQQKGQRETAQNQQNLSAEMQLEKYRADLKAETDKFKAELQIAAKAHAAMYQSPHASLFNGRR